MIIQLTDNGLYRCRMKYWLCSFPPWQGGCQCFMDSALGSALWLSFFCVSPPEDLKQAFHCFVSFARFFRTDSGMLQPLMEISNPSSGRFLFGARFFTAASTDSLMASMGITWRSETHWYSFKSDIQCTGQRYVAGYKFSYTTYLCTYLCISTDLFILIHVKHRMVL